LHPSAVRFAIKYIYESPYLNRLSYDNYVAAFRDMRLKQIYLREIRTNSPPPEILKRLPSSLTQNYSVGGFDAIFQRPGGTRDVNKELIERFFKKIHNPKEKANPVYIDDQKIVNLARSINGKVLVFSRQEIQFNSPSNLTDNIQDWEVVLGRISPQQLVHDYDLAIILHHSESNFAFTQAISNVIRAKRIVALDETGATVELRS
jgi:hypothetical protein